MAENESIVNYLVDAINRNGKPKKVLKNDKARSISYVAKMGEPNFDSKQLVSLMLKGMQDGIIDFVRSEPRIEWNETDFPVLNMTSENAKKAFEKLV
ncbi:MAG TPA: hypothetical protein DCW31_05080 [Lactobacillus sp.]|nr:hypothetical protein [Lactobacillus sp.]